MPRGLNSEKESERKLKGPVLLRSLFRIVLKKLDPTAACLETPLTGFCLTDGGTAYFYNRLCASRAKRKSALTPMLEPFKTCKTTATRAPSNTKEVQALSRKIVLIPPSGALRPLCLCETPMIRGST